ncbi:BT4734/BF3469 family protein [Elizabethkingia anophelis]|uniref:BT4734/BF3469 family protein n=1 Tax=Elizabethkingia anophelis TaxID=1117645 RepID=UPI003555D6C0
MPAVSVGFNFENGYIKGGNMSSPTGYLYIDVDGYTEEDFEINTTYVCAYWRSLSNTGMSIVVKAEGLTSENLKIATSKIAELLDIPYDNRAVSIDRLTVLTYDPNAYYNDNTEVIPIAEILPDNTEAIVNSTKSTHFNTINKDNLLGYECNGYKLRFNNLNELLQPLDIQFDENGFHDLGKDNKLKYAQVFIPFKTINTGQRESILKSIACQLVALNKNAPKALTLKYLQTVNAKVMRPQLSSTEVNTTLNKVYKKRMDKQPILNASRRFIYDETRELTVTQKRSLNCIKMNKDRADKTKQELLEVMKNWDMIKYGKMTIDKIKKVTGKNKKTVQKYYSHLKRHLKEIALPPLSILGCQMEASLLK